MTIPSITAILGFAFLAYIGYLMWSLTELFTNIQCTDNPCYKTYLRTNPKLQLALFTSTSSYPVGSEVTKVVNIRNFDYRESFARDFTIDIPLKTRRNGTLYMYSVLALDGIPLDWADIRKDGPTINHRFSLTEFALPKAAYFNLLGDNTKTDDKTKDKTKAVKPVTHFKSKANLVILTDDFSVSQRDVPPELGPLIRITSNGHILPVIQTDFFKSRLRDLIEIDKNTTELTLNFNYNPITVGKLRLMLQIEIAAKSMLLLGFTEKDVDEVKGIFSDTNLYLLCGTVLISCVHVLFDFLSFKNDVMFWRKKRNYAGLSMRTTIWRAFSQIIIFLYLIDENTSLLVLIPAGIAAIIELWKCKKMLKLELTMSGFGIKKSETTEKTAKAEKATQEFDREAMRYLSYLLYPLCVCGAIYSLIYQPHKSWYSWTLNSLVNGVYAFGFLFMLPQLFVNYKLKSVAALPWRAFMYKAFNTFIDDVFAFIITMPIAHRVACFRDDVVFVIYLYQRWLYPVDKSRLDTGMAFEDDDVSEKQELNNEQEENKKIK